MVWGLGALYDCEQVLCLIHGFLNYQFRTLKIGPPLIKREIQCCHLTFIFAIKSKMKKIISRYIDYKRESEL